MSAIDDCLTFYAGVDDLVIAVKHAAVHGVVIWEDWGVLVGWCSVEMPDVFVAFYAGGDLLRVLERAEAEDVRVADAHFLAWNRAMKSGNFRAYSKARLKNKLNKKNK